MNFLKGAIILTVVLVSVFVSTTLLCHSHIIVLSYYGFAVDSDELLYVAKDSGIDVYKNSKFVETIYEASNGYSFTIRDEKLHIATSGQVKIMDLSGNFIEAIDDSIWPSERYLMNKQKDEFVTDNSRYVATNVLGFYKITKYNDSVREIIYHIPVVDYIVNWARYLSFIFAFVMTIWVANKLSKMRRKRRMLGR